MVEVTQADRDAAANIVVPHGRWPGFPSDFRSGKADRNELTQAFARHRLASQEPQQRVEEVEEAITRVRIAVDKRESAVMYDLKRACLGREPTEQEVSQAREWATVSGQRLDDLQALLASLSRPPRPAAMREEALTDALSDVLLALDAYRHGGEYPDFEEWERKARTLIGSREGQETGR